MLGNRKSRWLRASDCWRLAAVVLLALTTGLLSAQGSAASASQAPNYAPSLLVLERQQAQAAPVGVNGTARPGDRVRVFEGDRLLGETVADANGKWQLSGVTLTPGQHDLRIQMVGAALAPATGQRGDVPPAPETPVTIIISVVAAGTRVTVTVIVNSPNGEVFVVVSVPIGESDEPDCPQPGCTQWYTVRYGDTLTRIAARFGTTVPILATLNGVVNPNWIFAGQELCVRTSG